MKICMSVYLYMYILTIGSRPVSVVHAAAAYKHVLNILEYLFIFNELGGAAIDCKSYVS